KTDLSGLCSPRRDHPNKKRPFVLLEIQRRNIWKLDKTVDDRKLQIWIVARYLVHDRSLRKTDSYDQVVASLRKRAHQGLDRSRTAGLHVAQKDSQLIPRSLHALPRRRVERLVVFAPDVKHDADARPAARFIAFAQSAGASGSRKHPHQNKNQYCSLHPLSD